MDGFLAHGKKIAGSTPLCVVYTWGQLAILEIEHGCQAAKVLALCLHVTLCGQLDCINASPTSRAQKTCRLFTMSTSFPGK